MYKGEENRWTHFWITILNASVAQLIRASDFQSEGRGFESHYSLNMVIVVQLVRTPDCGSGGRGFKSHLSPKMP